MAGDLRPNSGHKRIDATPAAYWVVAAALGGFLLIQAMYQPWYADFWVHLGAVREMAERPWEPSHPFVGIDEGDSSLSPYVLLLGLATRWSGADAITILAIAGFLNLVLWLYAFRRFVLVLTGNAGAPMWALLFTLLAWGLVPPQWSGFFNLSSIGLVLPYPSMFASAVALLALSSVHRWLSLGHRRDLVIVGIAVPVVLLTHLFTAGWSAIVGIAIVVSEARKDRTRRLTLLIGIGALGAALALLWPYYSLLRLFTTAGRLDLDTRELYRQILRRSFLALPGLVALTIRARRNLSDALVLTFVGTAFVFLLGELTDRWSFGRVFPGMMLAAHVALGDAVAKLRSEEGTRQPAKWVTIGAIAIFCIGFVGSYPGLALAVPRSLLPDQYAERLAEGRIQTFRPLREVVGPDDRVVASVGLNRPVAGMTGDVLVPLEPTFVEDVERRTRDRDAILSPSTGARTRRALLNRWDIRFLVLTLDDARTLYQAEGSARAVVLKTDDYVVFDALRLPGR